MNNLIFPVCTEFDKRLPYYFVGGGCDHEQERIHRPAGHPNYQWLQCQSGKGELLLRGKTYVLEYGQGMFLYPNEPHAYHALTDSWKMDCLVFDGTAVNAFAREQLKILQSTVYYIPTPTVLQHKIQNIYDAARAENPTRSLTCSLLVYELLLDLLRFTSAKQHDSMAAQSERLLPVFRYIDHHYAEHIALDTLADLIHLTPQYFCTLFKKHTSQTPVEYITMFKLRKSKEFLLHDKEMSVKKISRLVGFEDVSYFCAVFKRHEKLSPTEFRAFYG